jgi:hypothetical protein
MRLRKRLVELYSAAISGAGAEGQGQAQGMEPHMLCRHTLALLGILLDLHEHQRNLHADQHEHCQTWADLSSAIRSLLALQPTCTTAEGLLELPHFTDFAEARAFESACYKVCLLPAACCLLSAACCLLSAFCRPTAPSCPQEHNRLRRLYESRCWCGLWQVRFEKGAKVLEYHVTCSTLYNHSTTL